jgi:hypothetical protein
MRTTLAALDASEGNHPGIKSFDWRRALSGDGVVSTISALWLMHMLQANENRKMKSEQQEVVTTQVLLDSSRKAQGFGEV